MQFSEYLALFFVQCATFATPIRSPSTHHCRSMKSRAIKYIVAAAIAAAMLYFSFREVKWDDFAASLRGCDWVWIIVAMLAGVMSFWLRAVRWRELLLPIDPETGRKVTFNAINISYIVNLVLPRMGELARCGIITGHSSEDAESGRKKASYDKVLGTVVLERSWDVMTMLLLVLVLAAMMWGRFGEFFMDKVFGPVSGRLDAGLLAFGAGAVAVCLVLVWALMRFRGRNRVASVVAGFLKGLCQGAVSCLKMKKAWLFFLYTALIWAMYWIMSLAVLLAVQGMDVSGLGPEVAGAVEKLAGLGAADALFLMLAGSLSSLIPVPGGFGAFHYIVAVALSSVYGVPFSMGIVFATLSHESQTLTMLICGGASYVSESMTLVRK